MWRGTSTRRKFSGRNIQAGGTSTVYSRREPVKQAANEEMDDASKTNTHTGEDSSWEEEILLLTNDIGSTS